MLNELDHAELVALRNLLTDHPKIDTSEVTLYSTMEPCLMCFSTLLLNNISTIVWAYEDVMGGGVNLPLKDLKPLYRDMSPEITGRVMREQSLALFKQFFSRPDNKYWKDSLLANYTLETN